MFGLAVEGHSKGMWKTGRTQSAYGVDGSQSHTHLMAEMLCFTCSAANM